MYFVSPSTAQSTYFQIFILIAIVANNFTFTIFITKVYMKLHIRNITKEDFMEYRCVARNSLGDSDGSITLYGQF